MRALLVPTHACRDLYGDGGAISLRGCRLEPCHRDAGSPTGSSAHRRRGSGEPPTCSSHPSPPRGIMRARQSRTHGGLERPSAWAPLAWIDHAMHTSSYCGRGTCVPRYTQRILSWQSVSSNGTPAGAGAPVTDHSAIVVVSTRRAQSTIWMPATCLRSMQCRGRLVRTQHTSDFQDPQMCASFVPTGPRGD